MLSGNAALRRQILSKLLDGRIVFTPTTLTLTLRSDGSATAVASAAGHAIDGQQVNSDIHADADYRGAMAAVFTRRAIEAALARAAG